MNLLKTLANEEEKPSVQKWLLEDVKTNEDELSATVTAFQKANVSALMAIDKANRRALLEEDEESTLAHR